MPESAPFENPLIPNERLRQMLLAMHRLRALEESLPAKRRSGARGLEACLVAPAIGLAAGDLVSDTLLGPAIAFLRGLPLQKALDPNSKSRRKPVSSGAGPALALASPARGEDRMWSALGAAAALRTMSSADRSAEGAGAARVLLCYLNKGDSAPGFFTRAFEFAAEHRLPILFLSLPEQVRTGRSRTNPITTAAERAGVTSIAVDANDAVAIYRVSQESLGRARAGGGPALMECVPFILQGARGSQSGEQTIDPLSAIERYILERQIATSAWVARQAQGFARLLFHPVH